MVEISQRQCYLPLGLMPCLPEDAIRHWFAFYHDRHHQGVSAKHQQVSAADSHAGDRAITQGAQVYGAAPG